MLEQRHIMQGDEPRKQGKKAGEHMDLNAQGRDTGETNEGGAENNSGGN